MKLLESLSALFSTAVAIVSGLAAIWLIKNEHPILATVCVVAILVPIAIYLSARSWRNFRQIRRGLNVISTALRDQKFSPDVIVTFSRSAAAVAGMLAVNLGVEEIVSITRQRSEVTKGEKVRTFNYKVGSLIELNADQLNRKKILILSMVIDSSNTLNLGLDYLKTQGITADFRVATIYISPVARARWPDTIFASEVSNTRQICDELPWITSHYHYV